MLLSQRLEIEGSKPITIRGPLTDVGIETVGDVVNRILGFFVPFVGIILVFTFVWAGYELLTSGGNPDKVKSAKAKLTTAIIGVVILFSAFLVAKVASYIFNLQTGGMF